MSHNFRTFVVSPVSFAIFLSATAYAGPTAANGSHMDGQKLERLQQNENLQIQREFKENDINKQQAATLEKENGNLAANEQELLKNYNGHIPVELKRQIINERNQIKEQLEADEKNDRKMSRD
ncbi:MAG: hypothetical protein P4L50_10870 [Anaerolineaceae bacterium]|nr:hypothetical protein [Anaerolineaceae bacterium]